MSTRSAVARPEGDSWKGRYVHSDGYPTWQLRQLRELIARDGVETVLKTIVDDNYGWSYLKPDESGPLSAGHTDGRFKVVPGYGVAYTDTKISGMPGQDGQPYQQSTADDWITPDGDDSGTEWAYILYPTNVTVLIPNRGEDYSRTGGWEVVGTYAYTDLTDEKLQAIENDAYENETE